MTFKTRARWDIFICKIYIYIYSIKRASILSFCFWQNISRKGLSKTQYGEKPMFQIECR